MPRGVYRRIGNKVKVEKKVEEVEVPKPEVNDPMKPVAVDLTKPVKTKGGMAHSNSKEESAWGGKIPPVPKSELVKKTRSGMGLAYGK